MVLLQENLDMLVIFADRFLFLPCSFVVLCLFGDSFDVCLVFV